MAHPNFHPNNAWIKINGSSKILAGNLSKDLNKLDKPILLEANDPALRKRVGRQMKDLVYAYAKQHHLEAFNINGLYLGLAAGRLHTLAQFFKSHTKGMISCEKNTTMSHKYKELATYINALKQTALPHTTVLHTDILELLAICSNKYSILDLDLMCVLTPELIHKITNGISHASNLTTTIMLWHVAARATTRQKIEEEIRPLLEEVVAIENHILRYDKIDYFEGCPMACEVISIERGD